MQLHSTLSISLPFMMSIVDLGTFFKRTITSAISSLILLILIGGRCYIVNVKCLRTMFELLPFVHEYPSDIIV